MLLDLDNFKSINDRFGHAIGDRVLQLFADVAANCMRRMDLFGRLGGEEFAALLPDTTRERAHGGGRGDSHVVCQRRRPKSKAGRWSPP